MMELTKERLMALSNRENVGAICSDEIVAMARQLLASMEPEPVYQACKDAGAWVDIEPGDVDSLKANGEQVRSLYAAPQLPQPAVEALKRLRSIVADPKTLPRRKEWISGQQYSYVLLESVEAMVDDACRAAMLQGAEPVSQPYTLPDGWVAVPVEPTEDMVIAGFEAELREEFRDPEAWEAFEAMSGCEQAAHRAKLCWAAMIAAAPHQEVRCGC